MGPIESITRACAAELTTLLAGEAPVEAYPELGDRIPLPLIALEVSDIEPGEQLGRGADLVLHYQARVIFDPRADDADHKLVDLAAKLAVLVAGQDWGASLSPAELVQAGPDGLKPELDGYLVWLVEWTHKVLLYRAP